MFNGLQGSKVMRQRGVETLITEEPDDRIGHVRICGGDGQQWLSLPGTAKDAKDAKLKACFPIETIRLHTALSLTKVLDC